ncbi:globin [Cellulomonas hominis]|uniref:globin n=1 Tax=Cellulomonas hominis TaxID=156981 RepID=UPI001B9B7922|nr:globin [Cellulomonas hominis]VTR77124.1 Group 2 truncated hemoglobin GlbO [Cellulomonas hominis]
MTAQPSTPEPRPAGTPLPLAPATPAPALPAAVAPAEPGSSEARRRESFYEAVGGHETFARLVDAFYEGVATDPVLQPMYPEQDLGPARRRLTMFLEQYWGGPTTYSEERGHPRLRMRHMPFAVDVDARDRWLAHMRAAVDTLGLPPLYEATLWDYLERAAHSLVNTAGPMGAPRS